MENIYEKFNRYRAAPLVKSLLFIALFTTFLLLSGLLQSMVSPLRSKFTYGILGVIGGLLTVWIFQRKHQRPFTSVFLIWELKTPLRFIYGLAIGTAIFMAIIAALLLFSPITISYNTPTVGLQAIALYAAIIPLALMEEIGFRSYPQLKLNSAYGIWVSQFVVALCFGIYHLLNGWDVYIAFAGPFVWAFVFGLSALWSGGIAMSTGIHVALNILQKMLGMKGSEGALWKLDFAPGATKSIMQQTDNVGLIMQGIVLAGALLMTAWYQKRLRLNKFKT